MLPDAALEHRAAQQRLTVATLALTRTAWQDMTEDFDGSWRAVGPRVELVATSAQLGAARAGRSYLAQVLVELGIGGDADGQQGDVDPQGFVGVAGDGRPVSSLLYGAVVTAKQAVGRGAATAEALSIGARWLDMTTHTLVADTSRGAVSTGITARRRVGGWVRTLTAPSCGRCAILGGKFFRWNEGFARHPRCDCIHLPASDAERAAAFLTDPRAAFEAGQIRGLTLAQERAVRDGADIGQVVNSRRGMDTAASPATRDGRGQRRLSPEGIYQRAGDDRDAAVALLRRNGYLTAT